MTFSLVVVAQWINNHGKCELATFDGRRSTAVPLQVISEWSRRGGAARHCIEDCCSCCCCFAAATTRCGCEGTSVRHGTEVIDRSTALIAASYRDVYIVLRRRRRRTDRSFVCSAISSRRLGRYVSTAWNICVFLAPWPAQPVYTVPLERLYPRPLSIKITEKLSR